MKVKFCLKTTAILTFIFFACSICLGEESNLASTTLYFAQKIDDKYYRPWMLSEAALVYAKENNNAKASEILQEAYEIAQTLDKPIYKDDSFSEIAVKYAKIKDFMRALKITHNISSPVFKSETLIAISAEYIKEDNSFKALGLLSEAGALAGSIDNPDSRDKVLIGICDKLAELAKFMDVVEIIGRLNRPSSKIEALVILANAYSNSDEFYKAIDVLSSALDLSKNLKSDFYKPRLDSEIALAYAKAYQIEKAITLANQIEDNSSKATALIKIAPLLSKTGEKNKSLELLRNAIDITKLIDNTGAKSSIQAELSNTFASMQEFESAIKIAESIDDSFYAPRALAEIGLQYSKAGLKEDARNYFSKSLETAKSINEPFYKTWALAVIATKFIESGLALSEELKETLNLLH